MIIYVLRNLKFYKKVLHQGYCKLIVTHKKVEMYVIFDDAICMDLLQDFLREH